VSATTWGISVASPKRSTNRKAINEGGDKMVYKKSKLEYANGCAGCGKSCNFNGLRVAADSNSAAKRDSGGFVSVPKSSDLYGCNSRK
jgi:hypothetical protein